MAWLTGYTYRKKITIDHTKVDSDLTEFQIKVILRSTNFTFANARSDGYDVVFTTADGSTTLYFERQRHDQANSKAEYHVRVPSVTASTDTDIYMYYGKPSDTDHQSMTSVWDSYHKAVWHMNTLDDSTSNSHTLTNGSTTTTDTSLGVARTFSGTSQYVSAANSADWYYANGNLTFEVQYTPTATISAYDTIIGQMPNSANVLKFDMGASGTHPRFTATEAGSVVCEYSTTSAVSLSTNTTYNFAVVRDGTTAKIYQNGSELTLTESTAIGTKTLPNLTGLLYIGKDNLNAGRDIAARLSGLKISKGIARSAAWIKAGSYSQSDGLLTVDTEETVSTSNTKTLAVSVSLSASRISKSKSILTSTVGTSGSARRKTARKLSASVGFTVSARRKLRKIVKATVSAASLAQRKTKKLIKPIVAALPLARRKTRKISKATIALTVSTVKKISKHTSTTFSVVVSFIQQSVQKLVAVLSLNTTFDVAENLESTLDYTEDITATLSFTEDTTAVLNYTVSLNATLDFTEGVSLYMGSDSKSETINMVLGETKIINVTVYNSSGAAANLSGASAKFALSNSGMTEKTCTILNNVVSITINPADITKVGNYGYEFRIKDATNQVDSIKRGIIKVENKLTTAF